MSHSVLHYLCLATLLSLNLAGSTTTDDEEPKRTFRRAIDGTRGRKFYDPEEDGFQHNYGSSGRYDPDHQINDFSDIRNNVPGEPGVDYPSYTRLPETGFVCEADFRGYYADEAAGCQLFHVCDGSFLVSSFLCPVGSIFSQKLLTCDWWTKVDCSQTRNYHATNSESHVSDADDDEILRKAFEMASVRSAAERIPGDTAIVVDDADRHQDRSGRHRLPAAASPTVTERSNDLQTGPDYYSDYTDFSGRGASPSRYRSRIAGTRTRPRYRDDDYYGQDATRDVDEDVEHQDDDRQRGGAFANEFQPSYAPTVPTVITTARRFYSPTFPTTYRPTTERESRRRFDLEFESSDHLYTARGRSDDNVRAATAPSVVPKVTARSKVTAGSEAKDGSEVTEGYKVITGSEDTVGFKVTAGSKVIAGSKATDGFEVTDGSKVIGGSKFIAGSKVTDESEDTTGFKVTTDSKVTAGSKATNESKLTDGSKVTAAFENTARFKDTAGSKVTTGSKDIDLPILGNGANKKNDDNGKITESLAILTIDNENRSPDVFAYDHEDDASPRDDTNVETNSEHERRKIAAFLQPPPEAVNQFRITVLEESSTLASNRLASGPNSGVEILRSVELPATRIIPPFIDGNEATRESRVIRIFVNKDNSSGSSNNFGSSIEPESTSEKISSRDSVSSVEDNEGEHSETKIISREPKPEEPEEATRVTSKKENLTSDAKTESPSISSANATIKTPELENPLSAVEINAAAALGKVGSTSADLEDDKTEIGERHNEKFNVALNSTSTVSEEKKSNSSDETSKVIVSQEKNDDKVEKAPVEKSAIEKPDQSDGSEEILLKAKTIIENEKIVDPEKTQEILLTANMTVAEEKIQEDREVKIQEDREDRDDREKSSEETSKKKTQEKNVDPATGGEIIFLDARTDEDKTIEGHENVTVSEETSLNAKANVSDDAIVTKPEDSSTKSEDKSLNATTSPVVVTNNDQESHERSSRVDGASPIDGNIGDTAVEGSSPFEVTLTVNQDEEFDPNGELIRRLIAQQSIGDSVGAAGFRNFEIVRSNGPEASTSPDETILAVDSRNGRKIDLDRNVDEETLVNFRTNNFPTHHRSLVALVNGPNAPRPFSLESSHNVAVRTPSDGGDASTSAPLVSGSFRNNLIPESNRVSGQSTRQQQATSSSSFPESGAQEEVASGFTGLEANDDERIPDQLSRTFGDRRLKGNREKLIFELPQEMRSLDFITGQPLEIPERTKTRTDEARSDDDNARTTERSSVKLSEKTVVETEFIPSISFSLNSDAEREKYMEAVMKGLLYDIRPTEATKNDTDAAVES